MVVVRRRLPRLRRLADLDHQLVERGVVAGGEGTEGVGALKESLLDRLRYPLRQDQQFFLVGVQGVGETVDQGVGRVVAEVQPLVLDPAQVGEADADFCGQITKAPVFACRSCRTRFPNVTATSLLAGTCWLLLSPRLS